MEYNELKKIINKLINNRKIYNEIEIKYLGADNSNIVDKEFMGKMHLLESDLEANSVIEDSRKIINSLSQEELFKIALIFELGRNYYPEISFKKNLEYIKSDLERLYTDEYYIDEKLVNMNYDFYKKYFDLGMQRYEKNILNK